MTVHDWKRVSIEAMKEGAYAAFVEKYQKDEARRRAELAERGEALLEFVRADDTEIRGAPTSKMGSLRCRWRSPQIRSISRGK